MFVCVMEIWNAKLLIILFHLYKNQYIYIYINKLNCGVLYHIFRFLVQYNSIIEYKFKEMNISDILVSLSFFYGFICIIFYIFFVKEKQNKVI